MARVVATGGDQPSASVNVTQLPGLALFLASPASSFVTGSQIVIDGGMQVGVAD